MSINLSQIAETNPILTSYEITKAITISKLYSKIKLSISARLILNALAVYYNANEGYCFPKQNTLADSTGLSRSAVNNAIGQLRERGLILTTGDKGENLKYYFTKSFFELLNVKDKKTTGDVVKVNRGCRNSGHHEQRSNPINKKGFKNNFTNSITGIIPKSVQQTKEELEESLNLNHSEQIKSPYNDRGMALELIKTLSQQNNDISTMIINKLVKHWKIEITNEKVIL